MRKPRSRRLGARVELGVHDLLGDVQGQPGHVGPQLDQAGLLFARDLGDRPLGFRLGVRLGLGDRGLGRREGILQKRLGLVIAFLVDLGQVGFILPAHPLHLGAVVPDGVVGLLDLFLALLHEAERAPEQNPGQQQEGDDEDHHLRGQDDGVDPEVLEETAGRQ